jgi:hypothetical protein
MAAGEGADVLFVARDAEGVQKSIGGDVFTVSWERAGQDEATPATSGTNFRFNRFWCILPQHAACICRRDSARQAMTVGLFRPIMPQLLLFASGRRCLTCGLFGRKPWQGEMGREESAA